MYQTLNQSPDLSFLENNVSEQVSKMEHLSIDSSWYDMSRRCEYMASSRCQGSYQNKQFSFFPENIMIRFFL